MSSHLLLWAISLMIFSLLWAGIYKLSEALQMAYRQRLWLIKFGVVVVLVSPIVTSIGRGFMKRFTETHAFLMSTPATQKLVGAQNIFVAEDESYHFSQILTVLYILGVAVMISRLASEFFRAKQSLSKAIPLVIENEVVYKSSEATSPFSFGFLNPRIFIPEDFLHSHDERSIKMALLHEKTHIERHDLQWKFLFLLSRSLLFFNPVMNYLQRQLELEMEMECDRVTIMKAEAQPREYGLLLLNFAERIQTVYSKNIFAHISESNLKRRILAMKTTKIHRPLLASFLGLTILTVAIAAIAATSGVSNLQTRFKIKSQIIVGGRIVASPQMIVLANEEGIIEESNDNPKVNLRMKLVASDYANEKISDGIEMKFKVEYMEDGHAMRANPHVIVSSGETATVFYGSNDATKVEMRIVADRM